MEGNAVSNVIFYFDFVSPYSYMAFTMLQHLQPSWRLSLQLRPVRLPHIIKATHNAPPASVPARAAFLAKDLPRTGQLHGIPFNPPQGFLSVSMRSAGLAIVAAQSLGWSGERVCQLATCIWQEFFAKGNRQWFTEKPSDLQPLLETVFKANDARDLLDEASKEETLEELLANTHDAIEAGAFGVPTMLVKRGSDGVTEFFFGSDRFHHVAAFIGADPRSIYELPQVGDSRSKL